MGCTPDPPRLLPYAVHIPAINQTNHHKPQPHSKKRPLKKNEEHGREKKKLGGSWAVHGQCAHEIKKKKMGAQKKKKLGKRPFFSSSFLAPNFGISLVAFKSRTFKKLSKGPSLSRLLLVVMVHFQI